MVCYHVIVGTEYKLLLVKFFNSLEKTTQRSEFNGAKYKTRRSRRQRAGRSASWLAMHKSVYENKEG